MKLHTTKINLETSIKTSAVGYDSNNKEEADPSRQQFEDMLHHKRMVNETVDCGVLIVN